MPERDSPQNISFDVQKICLECGIDETSGSVQFNESGRGFTLRSRWRFTVGTQLAMDCAWRDARLGAEKKISLCGIVVGCERCAEPNYETTVLVLDPPKRHANGVSKSSRRAAL